MKLSQGLKFMAILLVLSFAFLLVASQSGYYEYELSKKTKLTDEAILQFEKDVSEGKSVDIMDYVVSEEKNYNNAFSNLGNQISLQIENVFQKGFDYLFTYLNRQIEK